MPLTLSTSRFRYDRIDTIYVAPVNTPDGHSGTFVRYIGTIFPRTVWWLGSPAAASSLSKLNEHPIKNATLSWVHSSITSLQ